MTMMRMVMRRAGAVEEDAMCGKEGGRRKGVACSGGMP